ncbi:MAG: hypothetical protein AAF986_00120 [Pseudomonadota bacterium]
MTIFLLYLACAGLYQAGEKRTSFAFVKGNKRRQVGLRAASWTLSIIALFALSSIIGWERGVTVWIALLGSAGFANLFVAGLAPQRHILSCYVALGGLIITAIAAGTAAL